MWKTGTETIPVAIGALGLSRRGWKTTLTKSPAKSASMSSKDYSSGTAHILRKALSIK